MPIPFPALDDRYKRECVHDVPRRITPGVEYALRPASDHLHGDRSPVVIGSFPERLHGWFHGDTASNPNTAMKNMTTARTSHQSGGGMPASIVLDSSSAEDEARNSRTMKMEIAAKMSRA